MTLNRTLILVSSSKEPDSLPGDGLCAEAIRRSVALGTY